jgi:lysozyme family protein
LHSIQAYTDSFHTALERTLEFEGVLANRGSADRGGLTKYGITHTLAALHGIADVRTLTLPQAEQIYHDTFWAPLSLDGFPAQLSTHLFDFAVTSGPVRSTTAAQRAWNTLYTPTEIPLKEDGVLGPRTRTALQSAVRTHPAALLAAFRGERYAYYKAIWQSDPVYASQNIRGWVKRV